MRSLLMILFCAVSNGAEPVSVSVLDSAGVPLKDVLVIVQTLERADREICRSLTDAQGQACRTELAPGLYRAIGTTPYGLWNTTVEEFLATPETRRVTLTMTPMGTHGYGDIVPIGTTKTQLKVLRWNGEPAASALVIVRDKNATLYLERFYRLDQMGLTRIELVDTPTVVVVIDDGRVVSQEISKKGPVTVRLTKSPNP